MLTIYIHNLIIKSYPFIRSVSFTFFEGITYICKLLYMYMRVCVYVNVCTYAPGTVVGHNTRGYWAGRAEAVGGVRSTKGRSHGCTHTLTRTRSGLTHSLPIDTAHSATTATFAPRQRCQHSCDTCCFMVAPQRSPTPQPPKPCTQNSPLCCAAPVADSPDLSDLWIN